MLPILLTASVDTRGMRGAKFDAKWPAFFYSTNNDTAIMRFKRGLRQLFRWVMPWWWV